MKDQYFADKRDYFKWDFLEDLLDGCKRLKAFTNITMLTEPDNTREGGLNAYRAHLSPTSTCKGTENRFRDDIEERCERFGDAVGAKGVAFLTDGNIAFLITSREPLIQLEMRKIIVDHAHKHALDCGELSA